MSPSSRFGVSGCANPHAGAREPLGGPVGGARRSAGRSRRRCATASPSSTHVVAAGAAAHTTCGSDAFATTASSGWASATRAPRVADARHLAEAVELVAAEVAEHEQLGVRAGRRPGAAPARRPRARRRPVRAREARVGRSPTAGSRRCEFVTSDRDVGAQRLGEQARRGGLAVGRRHQRHVLVARRPRRAASGAIAIMTRPLICAPVPRRVTRDSQPVARPAVTATRVRVEPRLTGAARTSRRRRGTGCATPCARPCRDAWRGSRAPRRARAPARRVGARRRGSRPEPAHDVVGRERLLLVEDGAVHFAEPAVEGQVVLGPLLVLAPRRLLLDPVDDRPRSGRPSRRRGRVRSTAVRGGRRGAARARISGSAVSASNQWNAWATVTASSAPSANGSSSAVAATTGTDGTASDSTRRMPATGSTATSGRTGGDEEPRELAGAGGEVDGQPAGPDAQMLDEPRHRLGRVRGPGPVVGRGFGVEPALRDLVDGHVPEMLPDRSGQEWRPHSVLSDPAQRPARASSPSPTGRVQGQQPIDA